MIFEIQKFKNVYCLYCLLFLIKYWNRMYVFSAIIIYSNSYYYFDKTPLIKAAQWGNLSIVKLLVDEFGANVNHQSLVCFGCKN